MHQEEEEQMESSLMSLINWVPLNFGEKNGDKTTYFYCAQDERNGRLAFVKKVVLSKDTLNEYQKEIKALKALNGVKNVSQLIETGIELQKVGNQMIQFGCILLSYVGDMDLCDAVCRFKWRYDEKNFISFAYNLIQAVYNIHSKGFVHRDLKLENIVLEYYTIHQNGEFSFPPDSFSIIDFGSSLNYVELYYLDNQYSGEMMNFRRTQQYSSPEFINEGIMSTKYDIFSLGVILFSMIAGHFPCFNFLRNEYGVIYNFLPYENVDDFFYKDEWKNVSDDIQNMIKSMLSFNPLFRPSATDLLKLSLFQDQDSPYNLVYDEEGTFY